MRLRASVEIRAPASQVFELISTPEQLPAWNASVLQARRVTPGPVALGSRAAMVGRFLGQRIESETEVVGFEPPHHFATRAVRGPRVATTFRLVAVACGTLASLQVDADVPGGLLGKVVAERLLRRELEESLERLRAQCERMARRVAGAEPLEGGDPACWLGELPADGENVDSRLRERAGATRGAPRQER